MLCVSGTNTITLDVNWTLFGVPCNCFWTLQIYNVAITVAYWLTFHPSSNHPRQHFIIEMLGCKIYQCLWIFHYKNVSWDDSNCVLIRKECHKNTHHDDMECHMTLNTIFSVVIFAKFGSVYFLAFWFWIDNLEKWMGWFWTNDWFSPFIGWESQLDGRCREHVLESRTTT
jgi:hypothetical protein